MPYECTICARSYGDAARMVLCKGPTWHCRRCKYACPICAPTIVPRRKPTLARRLFNAINQSDAPAVYHLVVVKGADPHTRGNYNETPLHVACAKNRLDLVKWLIPKVDITDYETTRGESALYLAVRGRYLDVVKFLLENDANPNTGTTGNTYPLTHACLCGDYKIAELLIKHGAEVNCKPWRHDAPLVAAITVYHFTDEKKNCDMVRLLLDNGANPNSRHCPGEALYQAVMRGAFDVMELLIARGADPKMMDVSHIEDFTCYHIKRDPFVRFLIDHGLVVSKRVETKNPAIGRYYRRRITSLTTLCLMRADAAPLLAADYLPRDMFVLICKAVIAAAADE